jgi:hypothetical protein
MRPHGDSFPFSLSFLFLFHTHWLRPRRQSLQTLSLAGTKAITNEALLQLFQKDGENQADTWPSLTDLDLSSLPAVNKEVRAATSPSLSNAGESRCDAGLCINCPALLLRRFWR